MPSITYASAGSVVALLPTALNSLASGGMGLSAFQTTNGYRWARFLLTINYSVAPTAYGVALYAVQSADGGTTWSDGGSGVTPGNGLLGFFSVRAVTGVQVIPLWVQIPPGPLKFLAITGGSQTTTSSGNGLSMELFTEVST